MSFFTDETSEKRNLLWITENAMICPKCNQAVKKKDGCNVMRCKCNTEFCWLCRAKTKVHGKQYIDGTVHSCNIWENKTEFKTELTGFDKEQLKEVLDAKKFAHYEKYYLTNYKGIEEAKKLKKEQVEKLKKMFSKIKNLNMSLVKPKFLETALDTIVESRRALAFTYPMGYFMKCENKK